jgi:hypothetical protein
MRLSPFVMAVYANVLSHTNKNGSCFPSVEVIAEEACMSTRQVVRALKELEERHVLHVERSYGGRHVKQNNVYWLVDPSKWKLSDEEKVRIDKLNLYRLPGSAYADETSDYQSLDQVTKTTSTSDYQSLDQVTGSHIKETHVKETHIRKTPCSPPGDFTLFFEAYPLQSEEAKALKEWLKLDPDEALAKVIRASVERQKAGQSWREHRYIPLAHNFLRGQRWKDDPLLVVSKPPASMSEGQWSFNETLGTYSQIIQGRWVKQPRAIVPDDVVRLWEGTPTLFSQAVVELSRTMTTNEVTTNGTTIQHTTHAPTQPPGSARGP